MQLILVWLRGVEYLDIRILHTHGQPFAGRTVSQGEYLRREVVLLELPSFPEIPGAHCVVETACPEFRAIGGDVDARGAIRVTLELPNQCLILQIPHGDVAVAAAAEANLRVRRYSQGVTRRCRGGQFGLDSWRRARQVPDAEITRLAAHNQRSAIR